MKKIVFVKVDSYIPEIKWAYSKEFVENTELNSLLLNGWEIQKMEKIDFDNQKAEYLIQICLERSNLVNIPPLFNMDFSSF